MTFNVPRFRERRGAFYCWAVKYLSMDDDNANNNDAGAMTIAQKFMFPRTKNVN